MSNPSKNDRFIRICLQAYDHRLLDFSVKEIVTAVKKTGVEIRGPIPLPTSLKRYTVLRSPHVYKKSREQFELRTHKRIIDIDASHPGTMDALNKLKIAAGVNVEVKY